MDDQELFTRILSELLPKRAGLTIRANPRTASGLAIVVPKGPQLTSRQVEFLYLRVVEWMTRPEIGRRMGVSPRTVEMTLQHACERLEMAGQREMLRVLTQRFYEARGTARLSPACGTP